MRLANSPRKTQRIVVWIGVTKGLFSGIEQILPVDESNGAGGLRRNWGHDDPLKYITPPEAFRRVERGADTSFSIPLIR